MCGVHQQSLMRGHLMKLFRTMALVGILSVAGLAPAQAGETLSQTALRALFPGTFHAVASGIVPLKITALRDGSLIGRMASRSDRGRWLGSGGPLCISLPTWTRACATRP